MLHILFSVFLGSQIIIAVADDVPTLDVAPNCHAAAADAPESFKRCIQDENNARTVLVAQWPRFAAGDKLNCGQEQKTTPSYVELLTCLQTASEARKLKNDQRQ